MKPHIDFVVLNTGDPKYILVSDLSEYHQIQDAPAIIELTPPGSNKPITAYVRKNAINAFHSVNLGLQCLETCKDQEYLPLSDGFWCISIKASPDTFYKTCYYLKTDSLRLEIDKILAKVGIEYDPRDKEFRDWYLQINIALDAAHAECRLGNIPSAKKLYEECISLADKFSECRNCY